MSNTRTNSPASSSGSGTNDKENNPPTLDDDVLQFIQSMKSIGPGALKAIDPTLWDQNIKDSTSSSKARATWTLSRLINYTVSDFVDRKLLYQFQEDFEGWTQDDFTKMSKTQVIATPFRDFIQSKGLFLGKYYNVSLVSLLVAKEPPKWPDDQLMDETDLDPRSKFFARRQALLSEVTPTPDLASVPALAQTQQTTKGHGPQGALQLRQVHFDPNLSQQGTTQDTFLPSPMSTTQKGPQQSQQAAQPMQTQQNRQFQQGQQQSQHPQGNPGTSTTTSNVNDTQWQSQPQGNLGLQQVGLGWQRNDLSWQRQYAIGIVEYDPKDQPPARGARQLPIIPKIPDGNPHDSMHYHQLPPYKLPQEDVDAQAAGAFAKMWRASDSFTGNAYDILDDKIKIFFNACSTAGIKPSQFGKVLWMTLTGRAKDYYIDHIDTTFCFAVMYWILKSHFDTEVNKSHYHNDWTTITFETMQKEQPEKPKLEVLQDLFDKLHKCQRALGPAFSGEHQAMATLKRACDRVPLFNMALFTNNKTIEGLQSDLRTSLSTIERQRGSTEHYFSDQYLIDDSFYAERGFFSARRGDVFGGRDHGRGRSGGYRGNSNGGSYRVRGGYRGRRGGYRGGNGGGYRPNRCFICGEEGCRSYKHTPAERNNSKARWMNEQRMYNQSVAPGSFEAMVEAFEGGDAPAFEQEHVGWDEQEVEELPYEPYNDEIEGTTHFCTAFYMAPQAQVHLQEESFNHRFQVAIPERGPRVPADQFQLNRYSEEIFQGILPDTGASEFSTAGIRQFHALQQDMPSLTIDETRAGHARVRFGDGVPHASQGTTQVKTPIGMITFHVVPSATPFLLCLQDMDRLGIKFDNLTNRMIRQRDGLWLPVIRKWGHPWFLTSKMSNATVHFTEMEMRRLHKRFGHPSVDKLHRLLTRAGHDVEYDALQMIQRFCHHCQMKGDAPRRFKFTLRDDLDFNCEVFADVFFVDGNRPVLHLVDAATSFQAGKFLKDSSAKATWEALKQCWIDTYLGPPDILTHDAGKNFASKEFRAEAKLVGITVHEVPVEAHYSIGKVERYHEPLRRAYQIIRLETRGMMSDDAVLQMAFKAVNDTAGPDGLVPTVLVFGAYPRVTMDSPPSSSQLMRAHAANKAMEALRKLRAQRKVNDALNTRNGPETIKKLPHSLPLGSEVRVYREKEKWQGPYKVIAVGDNDVTVETTNGLLVMRSTHVQPYERHPEDDAAAVDDRGTPTDDESNDKQPEPFEYPEPPKSRRRGRPSNAEKAAREAKEAADKAKETAKEPSAITVKRRPGRPWKKVGIVHFADDILTYDEDGLTYIEELNEADERLVAYVSGDNETFLSQKERDDYGLAIQLRAQGKITTVGEPFEAADNKEISSLLDAGVIVPVKYDPKEYPGATLFGCRVVREVKGKNTDTPYEKSRLVVCGFNDDGKVFVLTQAPTIQRSSQRLLFAIAPTILCIVGPDGKKKHHFMGRDITQAYVQAETELSRVVLVSIPLELEGKYPEGTVFLVKKPLYGLAESGMHWFATYSKHHREQLNMETSAFDPCLFISKADHEFGMTALQTDDTLSIGTQGFMDKEEAELKKAKFIAKERVFFEDGSVGDFNGCHIVMEGEEIVITQKGQADKLALVDPKSSDRKVQYGKQRARGAYIACLCQPEASFDLSVAAQAFDPTEEDIKKLNARLKWQIENKDRGLRYKTMDFTTAKLFVFVDGSFANNSDMTSQIGFIIVLGNETTEKENEVTITGNIVHWSSTKCKRVTRSVLASEIYGMVGGFDLGFCINKTLHDLADRLDVPKMPLCICTDSYSLYQCLVQLGTTSEKRLMIDIMSLRQSYENREISEIRWIHGEDNPADAMTKVTPNKALEGLITHNRTTVRIEGWVQRSKP